MNLTKLFQFEKKQKSRLYKEVEYLVTNYDLIKSFYSTYAEFCGSEKRITLRDIIPCESPMLGRYKATEIFEIIENWKHKYYWKDFTICDGILWLLRIRLSNGKYLKYEGHQMFPDNYTKLRGYLNRYVGKYVNKFE